MKGPLSSAKKRPSDTQSRGERRLLSANAQKSSSSGEGQHKRDQSKQFMGGQPSGGTDAASSAHTNGAIRREEYTDAKGMNMYQIANNRYPKYKK